MTTKTATEQFIEQNLPWNFFVNLVDITFITLGLSLISRETIMPLFISSLTDSKIAIGLIPATFSLGFYLPQLFVASRTETLKRMKPFVVIMSGIFERGPYLVIALATLAFAVRSPGLLLTIYFLLLGSAALGAGVATPAWFTMIGKVLPVQRRGIFFGVSGGLGALIGIVGAHFVGVILDSVPYPDNFAWLFIIAFVFIMLSWVGLALNREPDSLVVKEHIPLKHYLQQLPQMLRSNANFSRFLISYSVSRLGAMAVGFFLVFGNTNYRLSGTEVGMLTGILIGTQAFMNLFWGWLGDRIGHKSVLTASALLLALAALIACLSTAESSLIVAFVVLGAAIGSDNVSRFSIVLEFGPLEDQPTYIGLTNTLLAPVVALGPILGGLLATILDYRAMFLVAAALALAGGVMLMLWVREPRTVSREAITST